MATYEIKGRIDIREGYNKAQVEADINNMLMYYSKNYSLELLPVKSEAEQIIDLLFK